MRASNFAYVLLLGVVSATPACTVETHLMAGPQGGAGTGGSSATSGAAGKSGSAGQAGGSGGSAGSGETGGASGAAEAGDAGAGDEGGAAGSAENGAAGAAGAGGSVSESCDTSSFEFPEVTCATGSMSELTNPTCQDVFLCMGLADCASSQMDCAACLDDVKAAFESTNTCIQAASQATLTEACKSIAADSADEYPQCVPK